jgi:hypothetical protein
VREKEKGHVRAPSPAERRHKVDTAPSGQSLPFHFDIGRYCLNRREAEAEIKPELRNPHSTGTDAAWPKKRGLQHAISS